LIDGEPAGELIGELGEERRDGRGLLGGSRASETDQQDAGMGLPGMEDQLTEVRVHRHDEPLFADGLFQNLGVRHPGIAVPDRRDIMTQGVQRTRDFLAGADIDQDSHCQAPSRTR
jgi:hypothetical protein